MIKYVTNPAFTFKTKSTHSPFTDFMKTVYPLWKKAEQYIIKNLFRLKIGRGKFLLKSGSFCSHYYFIELVA